MDKVLVYTYRYMWLVEGSKSVNFKIVTDTDEGLKLFEANLAKVPKIEKISREYICEIDVSKMGIYENIDCLEVLKNETV